MSPRSNITKHKPSNLVELEGLQNELALLVKQGLYLHQKEKYKEAQAFYYRILAIEPNHFDALQLLGALLVQTNQFKEAIDYLKIATQINPNNATCFSNFGTALQALGLQEEALDSFDKAISISPNYAEAYFNRGNTLNALERKEEALDSYNKAISINPKYIKAYSNHGYTLQALGRLHEALASYDKAISINPNYADAYFNRANTLQTLGRLDEAIVSYDKAISINPNYADAYFNCGNVLQGLGRFYEALEAYNKAISINVCHSEAHYNSGVCFSSLGNLVEAIVAYDKAICINPNYFEAYCNRGIALHELGRVDEAVASYNRAIEISPNYAEAHWNLSLSLLLNGNFKDGWTEYEWRWKVKNVQIRNFVQPQWLGTQSLKDKKILLYAEQGLGDTIQFCRYALLVENLGAQVILEVQPALVKLLKNLEGVSQIIAKGDCLPDFDYQCSLLSLPSIFKTELNNIPSMIPYIKALPTKEQYWKLKLQSHKKIKVGLVWNGGFRPNQPEVWAVNARRNVQFEQIANINLTKFDFFSLQKGEQAEFELSNTGNKYWQDKNFFNYVEEINDFEDTAAIIANLDLIISVDTSTAHLSAAMGKPTWLVNRFDSCWRWLLNRSDSPWYETVKIYRQEKKGDWDSVMRKIKLDLEKFK